MNATFNAFTDLAKTKRDDRVTEFCPVPKQGFADCDQKVGIGKFTVAAFFAGNDFGEAQCALVVRPLRRFDHEYRQEIGAQKKKLATKNSERQTA